MTAAESFTSAAAQIAKNMIAEGVSTENAVNTAVDYLLVQMATGRPELLAKVIATSPLAR